MLLDFHIAFRKISVIFIGLKLFIPFQMNTAIICTCTVHTATVTVAVPPLEINSTLGLTVIQSIQYNYSQYSQENFFDVEIQIEMPHSLFESPWKTDIHGIYTEIAGTAEKIEKNTKGKKCMVFSVFPDFPIFATL